MNVSIEDIWLSSCSRVGDFCCDHMHALNHTCDLSITWKKQAGENCVWQSLAKQISAQEICPVSDFPIVTEVDWEEKIVQAVTALASKTLANQAVRFACVFPSHPDCYIQAGIDVLVKAGSARNLNSTEVVLCNKKWERLSECPSWILDSSEFFPSSDDRVELVVYAGARIPEDKEKCKKLSATLLAIFTEKLKSL